MIRDLRKDRLQLYGGSLNEAGRGRIQFEVHASMERAMSKVANCETKRYRAPSFAKRPSSGATGWVRKLLWSSLQRRKSKVLRWKKTAAYFHVHWPWGGRSPPPAGGWRLSHRENSTRLFAGMVSMVDSFLGGQGLLQPKIRGVEKGKEGEAECSE